jgi:hypothetical protein
MEFIVAVFFGARKKKHFMYSAVTVQARRCWSLEGSNLWKWKDMIVKKKTILGAGPGDFFNDPFSGYSRSIPPLLSNPLWFLSISIQVDGASRCPLISCYCF